MIDPESINYDFELDSSFYWNDNLRFISFSTEHVRNLFCFLYHLKIPSKKPFMVYFNTTNDSIFSLQIFLVNLCRSFTRSAKYSSCFFVILYSFLYRASI